MSTPSNGSWGDGPDPGQQYGGQAGFGQQSLGQGFGGQQGGYTPAPGGPPGPDAGYQQQPPHHQQPPQPQAAAGGGGGGIADLFSDFGFRKSLTENIASVAFAITVVWAVIDFVSVLANAWGSRGDGEYTVPNMGGFEAMMTTLSGLAWLIFVVVVARLFFELCINIARMARNRS